MASILIHTADESVTLTAQTVKRLLDRGDGDAALLYLALLRHHGTVQPRSLAGELRWEKSRIEAAEQALRDLRLLAPAAEEIPEPADEKPSYQRDDIARRLESSEEFRLLTAEVEKKLGKRLTTPDVGVLLGLNDYLGLPADVIFLLVNHCVERVLNCDLLILDDLGTEMVTTFVQSALYQIINGRLLEKKSTIVSTNLMPEAIAQRYSGQIASRIEGEYQLLPFVGEDIRVLKKKRGQ